MPPEPYIYKPRYSLRLRTIVAGVPALFFFFLCAAPFILNSMPIAVWVFVLLLGVLTSFIPFFTIREIRFLEEMVVRRHFLPDLFFSLNEIEQVGADRLVTTKGRVRMGELTNLEELNEKYRQWKAAKLLKQASRSGTSQSPIFPQRGYGTYASFWGLLIGAIFMMMSPSWLKLDPRWVLAGGFILIYSLYIYVIPRIL